MKSILSLALVCMLLPAARVSAQGKFAGKPLDLKWDELAPPQEPVRSFERRPLNLKTADSVWVNDAPRRGVEEKVVAGINHSWDTLVSAARTGKRVTITLMNAAKVEGTLLAIDTRSITVEQPGGPQAIAAVDVFRVRYAGVRKRHFLYVMLGSTAVGAVAGVIAAHSAEGALGAVFGATFGLPAGAIAAAVLPIGPPLYEAAAAVGKTP